MFMKLQPTAVLEGGNEELTEEEMLILLRIEAPGHSYEGSNNLILELVNASRVMKSRAGANRMLSPNQCGGN